MMKLRVICHYWVVSVALLAAELAFGAVELVDYLTLDHEVSTEILRAGNHDEAGENDYYFKVDAYALLIEKDQVEAGFAKRKKIHMGLGEYGDFKVKSLSFWKKGEGAEGEGQHSVSFSGEQIRSLVASGMRSFNAQESKIAVLVVIVMMEREKQFGIYGEDTKVGEARYFPVPETLPRRPATDDLSLQITDNKGTSVVISVKYAANNKVAKRGP